MSDRLKRIGVMGLLFASPLSIVALIIGVILQSPLIALASLAIQVGSDIGILLTVRQITKDDPKR